MRSGNGWRGFGGCRNFPIFVETTNQLFYETSFAGGRAVRLPDLCGRDTVETCRRPDQNPLGRRGRSRGSAARIPASDARAQPVAQSKRPVELFAHAGRSGGSGRSAGADSGALPDRIVAVGRAARRDAAGGAVVRDHVRSACRMAPGQRRAAPFRRGGLACRGLCQRPARRQSYGRIYPLLVRHHPRAFGQRGAEADGQGDRFDRQGFPATASGTRP